MGLRTLKAGGSGIGEGGGVGTLKPFSKKIIFQMSVAAAAATATAAPAKSLIYKLHRLSFTMLLNFVFVSARTHARTYAHALFVKCHYL